MSLVPLGELFALPFAEYELFDPYLDFGENEPLLVSNENDPELVSFSAEYLKKNHSLVLGVLFENQTHIATLLPVEPNNGPNEEVYRVTARRTEKGQVYLYVHGVNKGTRLKQFLTGRMKTNSVLLHRVIYSLGLPQGATIDGMHVHHIGSRNLDNRYVYLEALDPRIHGLHHNVDSRARTPIPDHIVENTLLFLKVSFLPTPQAIILANAPVTLPLDNLRSPYNPYKRWENAGEIKGPNKQTEPESENKRTLKTRTIIGLGFTRKTANRLAEVLRTIQKLGGQAQTKSIKAAVPARFARDRSTEKALADLVSAGLIERSERGVYRLLPEALQR